MKWLAVVFLCLLFLIPLYGFVELVRAYLRQEEAKGRFIGARMIEYNLEEDEYPTKHRNNHFWTNKREYEVSADVEESECNIYIIDLRKKGRIVEIYTTLYKPIGVENSNP